MRVFKRARQRREPTDGAFERVCFVFADDRVRRPFAAGSFDFNGRTETHNVFGLRRGIDGNRATEFFFEFFDHAFVARIARFIELGAQTLQAVRRDEIRMLRMRKYDAFFYRRRFFLNEGSAHVVIVPFLAMDCDAAAQYAAKSELHALLIERGGKLVHESYGGGYDAAKPHALYSGTKSFWGPLALRAERDGLIKLDETVGETFPEWRTGPRKNVTLRMLLQLIAGVPFGGLGSAVPSYEKALETHLKSVPGTAFTYGGIPLQIFGAVLALKLAPETPHAYLERRLLKDARVEVAQWRILKDGTQPLPTGAFLTAPMWLKYGRFILENHDEFAEAFRGSKVNAHYGLGWWLANIADSDVMYASGSGGQALYIVPKEHAVVAHFAKSNSWRHETFLRRLLQ